MLVEKRLKKNLIYIFISFSIFYVLSGSSFYKYMFVMMGTALLIWFKRDRLVNRKYIILLLPALTHILIGLISCVLSRNITFFALKQSCFYIIPFLLAVAVLLFIDEEEIFLKCLFIAMGGFMIWIGRGGFTLSNLFESQYAFPLGLFLLYFIWKRYFYWSFAAMVLLVLAHKRITFLAAVLCVIILWILMKFYGTDKKRIIFSGLGVAIIFNICYAVNSFNGNIKRLFSMLSINTQGRVNTWNTICNQVEGKELIYGKGLGYIQSQLQTLNIPGFALLHNDMLSSLIELGLIGMSVWLFSFCITYGIMLSGEEESAEIMAVFIIYTWLNYLTDNISIYINYLFPLYLIIICILKNNKKVKQ